MINGYTEIEACVYITGNSYNQCWFNITSISLTLQAFEVTLLMMVLYKLKKVKANCRLRETSDNMQHQGDILYILIYI